MFDPAQLRAALADAGAWSLPSTFDATSVHHGYRRIVVVDAGRLLVESFRSVIDRFAPVHSAWLSCIDPGGFVIAHRDASPWLERWHVPIEAAGTLETAGHAYQAEDGVPFQVRQWETHSVWNPTERARIHLVIDREVLAREGSAPFVKEDL